MILTGTKIREEVEKGNIIIDPFDSQCTEPNSYGFHLGSMLKYYLVKKLDSRGPLPFNTVHIPEKGFLLKPNRLYLGQTQERIGSDYYVPTLHNRLSSATLGLYIQISAPLGNLGAKIPWTLELRVLHPTVIYPHMLIGKIAFWKPQGKRLLYQGKYLSSTQTEISRLYQDNNENTPNEEI